MSMSANDASALPGGMPITGAFVARGRRKPAPAAAAPRTRPLISDKTLERTVRALGGSPSRARFRG